MPLIHAYKCDYGTCPNVSKFHWDTLVVAQESEKLGWGKVAMSSGVYCPDHLEQVANGIAGMEHLTASTPRGQAIGHGWYGTLEPGESPPGPSSGKHLIQGLTSSLRHPLYS